MKFSAIRFNDRDVVLFRGKGLISAAIIIFCSLFKGRLLRDWITKKKRYSHIGRIVIMTQELVNLMRQKIGIGLETIQHFQDNVGKPFLLESTTMDVGLETFNGVRLVLMADIVEYYRGLIVWRAFKIFRDGVWNGDSKYIKGLTEQERRAYYQFIFDTYHKPYEQHGFELAGMGTPWQTGKNNNSDFACSEHSARFDISMGLLKRKANEFSPQNYAMGDAVDWELAMHDFTCCLGREIEIEKG